ncbi:MAG: hypothetical protein FWG77_02910 [Treponema sp.]|nr:hypothetical protein [Treponema sp.]
MKHKAFKISPMLLALIPRTLALFILLYQLRLIAGDMADTSIFIAALLGALFTAFILYGFNVRPVPAAIIIFLIPQAIRLFIALPRLILADNAASGILLDTLLLDLDRNNFIGLLPFYWTAISTYFCKRSRLFLRADIIISDIFFLVLFIIVPASSIDAYRWPILMVGIFALVFFLQILSLVLSMQEELRLRIREKLPAVIMIFLLIVLASVFFIRPFQEQAIERGGGLLEPRLFRFDFSQVLRLESEISLSDDLVLIVRKELDFSNLLLRRYTLSGYNERQGFYRADDIDEAAHPQRLPNRPTLLPMEEFSTFSIKEQEYYIVNFDSGAFIGMNAPREIIPFETWDASSFNAAYAVTSHVSQALTFELINAVSGSPGPETLKMSPEEYAFYTYYGADEVIASFTRDIIGSNTLYWEQIQLVYEWLKFGDYRYSLRPGIAPDGDQLKYFLFTAKRGYCSYFAFAFTLMLRSIGIPSRVAAGFSMDPNTGAFNYFPVRADMAHAWTEVWYPDYGWIEYDPTTPILAEGEDFVFSSGTPPELFERLMREILENRSGLRVKEGDDTATVLENLAAIGRITYEFFARSGLYIIVGAVLFLLISIRSGYYLLSLLGINPRKRAGYLWAHVKRRLALKGHKADHGAGEGEWAKLVDEKINGVYSLYLAGAAARFSQNYSAADMKTMTHHYKKFNAELKKIPRRFIILLLFLVVTLGSIAQDEGPSSADMLFESAMTARFAENWERAIELLSEGAREYPDDFRFNWSLGNLYYNRRLFHLAWDEYRRAEQINAHNRDLILQLANTAGYLNLNELSAEYYEQVLELDNNNREVIGSLAWMYFKLHRLEEAEHLLLKAISELGDNMDFSMLLGTIYSGMFRYEAGRDAYLESIREAELFGDRLFLALSYYNLSILESRFYQFDLAFDCTTESLAAMNRSSGRLARGELYLRRMDLSSAYEEFMLAFGMDRSPLSKLNLAHAFQIGGRLIEAVLYARDCLENQDQSWMMNYGIDPVRYNRDVHEILVDSYSGLLKAESFSNPGSLRELVQSIFRKVSYRYFAAVHTHLFRKYSRLSGDGYGVGAGPDLDALLQYANAFEGYPRRARSYLIRARAIEEPIIPLSAPYYDLKLSRVTRNSRALIDTLYRIINEEFDPIWERDKISDAYTEIALRGRRAERLDAAERLFAINRGGLLKNGIRLPVKIEVSGDAADIRRVLIRAAGKSGLMPIDGDARYTLRLSTGGDGSINVELYDGGRGIIVSRQNLPLPTGSLSNRAAFSRGLRDGIFTAF